jgi:hypothetical protein
VIDDPLVEGIMASNATVRFRGLDGVLEYADGRDVRCSFEILQYGNADVYAQCRHDHDDWMHDELDDPSRAASRLRGMTDGSRLLLVDGGLQPCEVRLSDAGSEITYYCGSGSVLTDDWEGPAVARFAITNLLFRGLPRDAAPDRPSHRALDFTAGGRSISIVQVPDYLIVARELKASHGIEVTCHAHVAVAGRDDIEVTSEVVDRLCYLLTLATGTVVSWTAYDVANERGESVRELVRSAVTRPFSGPALVDNRDPGVLRTFIESLYPEYVRLDSSYCLARVIHARMDVNSGGFLETRALATGVLLEYIVGTYLRVNQASGRVRKGTLEARLRAVCDELVVDASDDDLKAAARTRHKLAHEMTFATSDARAEYSRIVHLLDKVLLRLLNYSGPYVDRRQFKTVVMEAPPVE